MNILLCGGGALGSHAIQLARNLDAAIAVIDFDRVETKNLASQWFVKPMLGKNKASALAMQSLNFYGNKVKAYTVRLTELNVANIFEGFDLLVDCFDNAASRQLVQNHGRQEKIPCLHGGLAADGSFGAVRWDKDFIIDHEKVPGQATCEGGQFLPLIARTSCALVDSMAEFIADRTESNWNLSLTESSKC